MASWNPVRRTLFHYHVCNSRPPGAHPTASKLQQGCPARRRPRSAAAVLLESSRSTPRATDPFATPSNAQGQRIAGQQAESTLSNTAVRPFSAASSAGQARPPPARPLRCRPVTATGTGGASSGRQSSTTRKQRRRAVSAGGAPLGPSADHRIGGSLEGFVGTSNPRVGRDSVVLEEFVGQGAAFIGYHNDNRERYSEGSAGSIGGGFWHKHKDLGPDATVMQRATEFVADIMQAKKKKEQVGNPQQRLGVNSAYSNNPSGLCFSISNKRATARRKASEAGRRQPRKHKRVTTVKRRTTFTVSSAAKRTKAGVHSANVQEREELSKGFRATTILLAHGDDFPFPTGGGGVTHDDNKNKGFVADDLPMSEYGGDNDMLQAKESNKKSGSRTPTKNNTEGEGFPLTPLALDIFCSMRPTLLEHGAHARSNDKAKDKHNTRHTTRTARHLYSEKDCPTLRKTRTPSQVYPPPSSHPSLGHSKMGAWTSIFGAVCAGAARGRAREEVLKAARRQASRHRHNGRSVCECDTVHGRPTAPVARTMGKVNSIENETPRDTALMAASASTAAQSGATRAGDTSCERNRGKAGGDEFVPDLSRERQPCARKLDKQPEGDEVAVCDDGSVAVDVDGENEGGRMCSNKLSHLATMERALTTETSTGSTYSPTLPFPLLRHPGGGGTTRIGVNAPRSLQVSPGGRGLSGVEISRYDPFFQRREANGARWRRPRRRPATAGGAVCHGASQNVDVGRCGKDVGGPARPETAGSFFPCSSGITGRRAGVKIRCCKRGSCCGKILLLLLAHTCAGSHHVNRLVCVFGNIFFLRCFAWTGRCCFV